MNQTTEYLCICSNGREMSYIHNLLISILIDAGDELWLNRQGFITDRTHNAVIRFITDQGHRYFNKGFRGTIIYGRWLKRQIDLGFIHGFADIDICIKKSEAKAKMKEEKEKEEADGT